MNEDKGAFAEHVVLELLGHRRLGGYLTEQEIAGQGFLRIDIPGPDGTIATQFVNPNSVYAITPVTEAMAKAVALSCQPEPVTRWELQQLEAPKQRLDENVVFGCDSDGPPDDIPF